VFSVKFPTKAGLELIEKQKTNSSVLVINSVRRFTSLNTPGEVKIGSGKKFTEFVQLLGVCKMVVRG
jgi:hypothetical protein